MFILNINKYLEGLKAIIVVLFFIPSGILYFLTATIIPVLISFVLFVKGGVKCGSNKAILCAVIMHIFIALNYIAYENNSGTDDSFNNLSGVGSNIFYCSLFTFIVFIFLILYCIFIYKSKKSNSLK